MNRNTPSSHFDLAPQVTIRRSRFNRDFSLKTSFDVGELVPIYLEEILPGDGFDVKTSKVARLQTLKTPVYDNLYLDTYFFFVPCRLIWDHFVNMMGENTESAWIPETEYTVPQVTAPETGWNIGTLADYFGLPTGVPNISVSALPFRAYCKIVDDWFRDQNLQDPVNVYTGDSDIEGSNGSNYITDMVAGGSPFIAAKYHDYYTSGLPGPQKGPDVQIPLSSFPSNQLPVYTIGTVNDYYAPSTGVTLGDTVASSYPLAFASSSQPQVNGKDVPSVMTAGVQYFPDGGAYTGNTIYQDSGDHPYLRSTGANGDAVYFSETNTNEALEANSMYGLTPVNLVAGGAAGDLYMATINSLRTAFQIQRFYEQQSRSGSRYIETLRAMFGVISPDARLQRSEYLGGKRMPLNISQVTQLGATNETSPLGDVAGMSVTTDVNFDFSKSFVEHGYVIGLAVARYDHTYQQGINRMWSRRNKFEYFWPVFASLGESPILVKEIYATGEPDNDELVFAYQEAWAEYRYHPSMVTSEMRSSAPTSLDMWHFADYYNSRPSLSASWIQEDKANVDRTLAVTSAVSNQIFCDFFFENRATRPMPLYSIPGLIDHF